MNDPNQKQSEPEEVSDADADEVVVEEPDTFRQQDLAAKVAKLKDELAQCRTERNEYLSGWQRAKADFINARKEEEHTRETFVRFAGMELLREIVHIANLFDHAFEGTARDNPYVRGFGSIRDELYKILERHGATPIQSVGQAFDASLHEAIESLPTDDQTQDGTVVEEVEKGFRLEGKVIRPSKVKVAVFQK